jgi:hypothetical protein
MIIIIIKIIIVGEYAEEEYCVDIMNNVLNEINRNLSHAFYFAHHPFDKRKN